MAALRVANTTQDRRISKTGNKWESKLLFLAILDPRLSIVKRVFDCRLLGVNTPWSFFSTLSAKV